MRLEQHIRARLKRLQADLDAALAGYREKHLAALIADADAANLPLGPNGARVIPASFTGPHAKALEYNHGRAILTANARIDELKGLLQLRPDPAPKRTGKAATANPPPKGTKPAIN